MRLSGWMVGLALTLVGVQGCATAAEDDEVASNDGDLRQSLGSPFGDDVDSFDKREQWIDTYGAVPSKCVENHDALDGTRAIFHGCYDWHSSVHAHWATYRMDLAGTGHHGVLATRIDHRLDAASVEKVATELAADPSFENPYGRAWLLRLVSEHETWSKTKAAPSSRLRSLGDATAKTLLDRFASRAPDPRTANYQSDAWALSQLVGYGRATEQPTITNAAKALVQSAFAHSPLRWADTNDSDPSAFMSTYWSSVYAITTLGDSALAMRLLDPGSLPAAALTPLADPNSADDVHHLGINWSRAWAIKALARASTKELGATHPTTKKLVAAYHAHVLAGRERHFKYRGNYYAYDHWVPQFAVYAITD